MALQPDNRLPASPVSFLPMPQPDLLDNNTLVLLLLSQRAVLNPLFVQHGLICNAKVAAAKPAECRLTLSSAEGEIPAKYSLYVVENKARPGEEKCEWHGGLTCRGE